MPKSVSVHVQTWIDLLQVAGWRVHASKKRPHSQEWTVYFANDKYILGFKANTFGNAVRMAGDAILVQGKYNAHAT